MHGMYPWHSQYFTLLITSPDVWLFFGVTCMIASLYRESIIWVGIVSFTMAGLTFILSMTALVQALFFCFFTATLAMGWAASPEHTAKRRRNRLAVLTKSVAQNVKGEAPSGVVRLMRRGSVSECSYITFDRPFEGKAHWRCWHVDGHQLIDGESYQAIRFSNEMMMVRET